MIESFIVIPSAPTLDKTTVRPGDTLVATTRYVNYGRATGSMRTATQTIRRPGQTALPPAHQGRRLHQQAARRRGRTPEGGRIVVTLYRGNRRIGSGAIVARRSGFYSGRVRLTRAGKRLLRSIVVEARK